MAEKILKTRIQLRYDTLANWTTNDPVLKKGELAVATIDVAVPANKQLPPVMFKVGDGTSKFSQLEWASALAADVYDWAKKTGIEVNTSGTGAVVTGIAWDVTNKRLNVTKGNVDLSDYVPTTRTIAGVDLKDNITKAEMQQALNVADGATKVVESTVSGWGFTKNAGTVTGITMNGAAKSVGTDGVVDLGTVITSHQDISGKQNKAISIDGITAKTVEGALKEIDEAAAAAQTTANGKYSKPSGGIPKSDLASAVQTSLGKADTALQSHQTVTLASGTNNGTLKLTVGGTATDNIAVKGLGTAAYTASTAYATAAQGTKADNAMPKAGGTFTGAITVQAPSADMNPATKQYVDTAIGAVKQFEYQVVTELPTAAQATMGKIYLIAHSHNPNDGQPDSYDEFITVLSGSTYKWERIGNTDIDLSGYVPTSRKVNNKALSSDINLSASDVGVTETAFPGLKKTGTVTAVKMNGTTKNPSSGVVDLGTVITSHQSLDGKQDKLSDAQLKAVNSGITADKVGTYDDYATTIAGKQDKLTTEQTNAVNSGITKAKVNTYDGYASKISTLEGKPGLDKVGTVTSVSAGVGLKITGTASVAPKVEIDEAITFVLDCGDSAD